MVNTGKKIQIARQSLGLSEKQMADRLGIGIDAYWDVENHADEFGTVLSITQAKLLCGTLGLDFLEMAAIKDDRLQQNISENKSQYFKDRADLISQRRNQLAISVEQLADQIGFEKYVVADLERDPTYLDNWSIDLVVSLANVLQISPVLLLIPNIAQGIEGQ